MSSPREKSFNYGYNQLDISKIDGESKRDSEEALNSSAVSESDGLMSNIPLASRRSRRGWLRRNAEDPLVSFLMGGLMFTVLVIIGVATLALIQFQSTRVATGQKHSGTQSGEVHAGADLRTPDGLRITPDGRLLDCGDTAESAINHDCPFDSFAFSWVPPACHEQDLMEEALNPNSYLAPYAAGIFPWARWSNFTDLVPQTAEALSKYKNLWTNNAWHKAHCLYEWRLVTRAMHRMATGVRPVYVLKRALEVAHVNHCNQLIADPLTQDASPIWAMRSVGRCIRLDEPEDDWEEPEINY